LRYMDNAEMY